MGEATNGVLNNSTETRNSSNQTSSANDNPMANQILSGSMANDVQQLKVIFDRSSDVVYREFDISGSQKGALIFIEGIVDITLINSDILKPLLKYRNNPAQPKNIQIGEI